MKRKSIGLAVALCTAMVFATGCKKSKEAAPTATPDPNVSQANKKSPRKSASKIAETPGTDKEADTTGTVKESAATGVAPKTKTGTTAVKEKGACDAKMAAEVLKNGVKVLAGVTLKTSTAQSELLASIPLYKDKTVRIEGPIVGICQKAGCWSALRGPNGKTLNLKVTDGVVDFRKVAKVGHYAGGRRRLHAGRPSRCANQDHRCDDQQDRLRIAARRLLLYRLDRKLPDKRDPQRWVVRIEAQHACQHLVGAP